MFTESLNEEDIITFVSSIISAKVLSVKTDIGHTDFVNPNFKYTACIYVKVNGHFKPNRMIATFNDKMFVIEKDIYFSHAWQNFMREKFGSEYSDKVLGIEK